MIARSYPLAFFMVCVLAPNVARSEPAFPPNLDRTTASNIGANSYANVQQVRTTHIALDLVVDFAKRRLRGTAELVLLRVDPGLHEIVLDTRDLDIRNVETREDRSRWQAAKFSLGTRDEVIGAPLIIALRPATTRVRIHYSTLPTSSGLQWLKPAQTLGEKHPFLYTQSEPIHTRSWIPLQDTPFVRATYEARVRVPKGLRAVMSAEMDDKPDASGAWTFRMPQAIPGYLIALAVGDINFRRTGPRTGVYAEPAMLQKAAFEFGETERTLQLMEQAFGPYRWQRYDILVLPLSFPYGGMENPRLTFCTPTVITGDRMLVSLVSHELAHSWSGNLVTNASWNDFWLNEGFTQYITYRLLEMQFGQARADMERVRGWAELKESMAQLGKIDWPLVRTPPVKDPDTVLSSVPYERGALFLTWLEAQVGRPAFDTFLRGWFDDHAFQSAATGQFVAYLNDKLLAQQSTKVTQNQVDAWLYRPEIPDFAVLPHSDALTKVDAEREAWLQGKTSIEALPVAQWSVHEWEQFLGNMPDTATPAQVRSLDARFKLSETNNAILASMWFRVAIRHGDKAAYPALERYLGSIGRTSLIKPLYLELAKSADGKAFAWKVYARAKDSYHPIARKAVERMLNGKNGQP